MTKRKKSTITTIVIIGVAGVLILVAAFINPNIIPPLYDKVNYVKHTHVSREGFDRYFNSFEQMMKFAEEFYNKSPLAGGTAALSYNPDSPKLLSDFDENVAIDLNKEERGNIQDIVKVFSDGGAKFNGITVDGDYSYFGEIIHNRGYEIFSIMYSRSGTTPEFLTGFAPSEYVYYIDEVRDNWYFLSAIPRKGVTPRSE